MSRANATGATTPLVPGEAMAALIQATLTPIVAPLVAELTASRQTVERQADQLVSQAETIGELRATVAAQDARIATLDAPESTQGQKPSTEPSRLWWRSWGLYGVIGLVAFMLAALLLGLLR